MNYAKYNITTILIMDAQINFTNEMGKCCLSKIAGIILGCWKETKCMQGSLNSAIQMLKV